MTTSPSSWVPRYRLTPAMARALMEVGLPLPSWSTSPSLRPSMRTEAPRPRALDPLLDRIEGNRLTLAEAEQAIARKPCPVSRPRAGRDRSPQLLERSAPGRGVGGERTASDGELVQRIHRLVERGARGTEPLAGRAEPDSRLGVRSPRLPAPEAKDVPFLMSGLVTWVREAEEERLPGPDHRRSRPLPVRDDPSRTTTSNGRTARLLATFLLTAEATMRHAEVNPEIAAEVRRAQAEAALQTRSTSTVTTAS